MTERKAAETLAVDATADKTSGGKSTTTTVTTLIPTRDPQTGELSITLDGWTLRGKSVGGRETCIIVEKLRLAFDMGYQPDCAASIQNVLISHGHPDHSGCLPFCYADRKQKHIDLPWQIIMPADYVAPFKQMAAVFSSMSRGGYPAGFVEVTCEGEDGQTSRLQVVKPFETLAIDRLLTAEECAETDSKTSGTKAATTMTTLIQPDKSNYVIHAYKMDHKITSFGYVISEMRKKRKAEFDGLCGRAMKELRQKGTEIDEIVRLPMLAFTGDTRIEAVLAHEPFQKAKILILECTHWEDDDKSLADAKRNGHVHFSQLRQLLSEGKFADNQYIVLCHLSQKYRRFDDVSKYLAQLSDRDRARIVVWL